MDGGALDSPPLDVRPSGEDLLDSWKEIAEYLKRSVRTVRRWEAEERLPVHRHIHHNSGTVYAFKSELDAWLASRTPLTSSSLVEHSPNGISESLAQTAASSFEATRPIVIAGTLLIATLLLSVGMWQLRPVLRQIISPSSDRRADVEEVDPDASRLFFKSLVAASRGSAEGWQDAIAYCQQAIDKQPNFAAAYSRMALFYQQLVFTSGVAPQQFMPQSESAARKAIALDDTLAEAHAVLGAVLYRFKWEWAASEHEFRRALALNPNYADGHRMFSVMLDATGRHEEALVEAHRSRDLDPLSLQAALNLGLAYRAAGQYDLAIEEFRGTLKKNPNGLQAHFHLGNTYVERRMFAEGIAELQTAVALSHRNPNMLSSLGYAYGRCGRATEARAILEELEVLADRRYVAPSTIGLIYVGLEDKRTAHAWLEKAYLEHDTFLVLTGADIRLVKLRSDPDFRDVFSGMGLVR